MLDSKVDAAVVADAPATLDHLGPEAAAHFAAVRAGLDRRGIPYEIAPRLVRGLDYYNRTVFEYQARSYTAAQDALGGGGRYDPLAELLGGPATPGVGLAMGVDRIVAAMPGEAAEERLAVFVVVADRERRAEAVDLVAALRSAGPGGRPRPGRAVGEGAVQGGGAGAAPRWPRWWGRSGPRAG